jgi:hypothetical protein
MGHKTESASVGRRARVAKAALVVAAGFLVGACADSPVAPGPELVPQFGNGNGRGGGPPGGGGGGTAAPLTVTLGPGTITHDGGGSYIQGVDGVEATLNDGGAFKFIVSDTDPRQVYIGEIVDVDGATVRAPETGLHGMGAFSMACCDLRALGAGDSLKVELQWLEPDTKYVISMGSTTNCSDTGGPWAQILDRQLSGADTVWTIHSQGTAHLCVLVDKRGVKDDSTTGYDVLFDFDLTLSTMNN